MIKAHTRDDESNGIILELSGHADPIEGDPPGLGSRICAGVSSFTFALAVFVAQNDAEYTPDPPGSGFLHLRLRPEHFHLFPLISHFLQQMQDSYPNHVEFKLMHNRSTRLPIWKRLFYCIKAWWRDE